jgi:tRNA A-37 threonylcarbamoyl transferase component Bud32/tetratricopeptide (TPR) repeat protein
MHDAGFERLEELFHSALALPPAERPGFLRDHCHGDEALRAELEEMLRLSGEPDGLLDVPVLEQIAPEDLDGQQAGRWRIGRKLGEGGLGVVHEAEEIETGRKAAIKFLRPGLDAGAFRRRFLKERRILSALEHPHIARLYDGGVDSAGRPYLAMEFVDGQPLDHYLSETRPGSTARLGLFVQVCQAVQYLHGALVAHGDLKPSNILVGADGNVKLLDFGAARLLQPRESTENPETTMTRAFLTPHYASPEQKQGEGPSVRSDIYSLGVILGDAFPGANRDLAAIRDMCCRPEAAERYQSVLEIEQDLNACRANQPVRARRQDRLYRASKFLRRNAVWVASAAAILATAATGAFFVWRDMRQSQQRLGQMRSVVRTVLDSGSGPVVNGAAERRAMRDSLESAIRELESSGSKELELELSAAWRRLGAARLEEGNTPGGVEALERSYRLADQVWKNRRDPQAIESKAISLPLWALALHSRRKGDEVWRLANQAIAFHQEYRQFTGRPLPPQNPYYRLAAQVGIEWVHRGQPDRGRPLLLEALGAARAANSPEHIARALVELAALETAAGASDLNRQYCAEAIRTHSAVERFEDVCGDSEPTGGPSAERIAALRVRIAARHEELRHDPDRYQILRRTAALHQRLAALLRQSGQHAEARAELARAVSLLDDLLRRDPDNRAVAIQAQRARRALQQLPQ